MLDEASLHLARCSHGARISVEISHCNLAAIRQNEQNGEHGWRIVKRLLLIRESSLAKSLVVPSLFFFLPSRRRVLQGKQTTCTRGGKRRSKDAIGAPVVPKSCYLRLLSVTVISHPFVFGIALNWLARACVFPRPMRHACACLLRISLSSNSTIFTILDAGLN